MGFAVEDSKVRGDLFKDVQLNGGKWYETVALDMRGYYDNHEMPGGGWRSIHDSVLACFQEQVGGHHGMLLVVLEPYHVDSHPVSVWVP
jgi:hypothetical protein